MPVVLVAIGAPGSGKTIALREFHADGLQMTVYICADDIRSELAGDALDQGCNKLVWQRVYAYIQNALCNEQNVIVDATNARSRDRKELLQWCRKCGADIIAGAWFRTPLPVCLERNMARERVVPGYAVERMHRALEGDPPALEDGFDLLEEVYV